MKLKSRSALVLALASALALGAPITAAYADDESAEATVEEVVEETVVETAPETAEPTVEEAPPALAPSSEIFADGNIEIVNATCLTGETIAYVTPLNAAYDPATPPVPASYPYAYNIVLVPNANTTPLVDSWNGTLTGPLDCSGEASVSTVPATCELGEQLVYGDLVKAAFLSGGTPDGTFGPGFYDLVAESDSGVFFSDGGNAAYFSDELAGPLDPSDPLCGGEEELIGEVGELLPWTAATNQPSYWEDFGPHENATCYSHSVDSSHGSITDGGKTVTLNAYGASWPGDHWELLVVKGGSVSNNVIVHPLAGVAYASPLNAAGQQSDVSHFIVCKGTTPDVEPVEVTPSLVFTPGTCQATGTVTPTASDDYTWEFSGPASARIVTFSAVGNVTLTQTVFGPYDVRQTDWNDPACQPEFTFVEQCTTDGLFVELSYTNNSKWDRWPDYSFTGDTKVPTDYGSGPTWNTVKVTPGETKVIWSYTFPEDYNGGTVDVWYQDILGAERDIDTAKVTVTLDTDCAELPNTSTSDSTNEVCVAPGDIEGGTATFSLTAGDEGLSTIVRFKSLGDGTGGTAETFYRLDGTTGAPGEIVDYEAVTLAPGDTYTTTVVALSAGDYRFTLTGGLSNSERRALQQGVSIVAVDCPPEEEEPPVVDDPPVKEEPTGLAYTGSGDVNGALGIGLMALIAGIGMMVFRRRPVRQ